MKDESTLYWLWLSERCGVASRSFGRLMERFDNPFDLYRLEEEEIEQLDGIDERTKNRLCNKNLDFAYETKYACERIGASIVAYGDPRYPDRLKSLEDPPVLLYVLGNLPEMNERLCIGMVGTRRMSEYGRDSAYKISYELASAYGVVVSGMALGVDGVSAAGALAAGGSTVAVLGCGLSVVYPKEHKRLMRAIAKYGAVVTEYPLTERPHGSNFPKRNRIISGLCQGVLVVEGAVGSGSLITAAKAEAQGRDVFALPGKINESNSEGPNDLIRNGAMAVVDTMDILNHYDFLYHDRINYGALTRAKKSPYPCERALADYGVYARAERGFGVGRSFTEAHESEPKVSVARPDDKASDKMPSREAKKSSARVAEAEVSAVISKEEPRPTKEEPRPIKEECLLPEGLDPVCEAVWRAMPTDRAVSLDTLAVNGISVADAMMALTMLEVLGLLESLPGGMYRKK